MGLTVVNEIFREDRQSYKLDLAIGDHYQIELFSFPDPPKRITHPESTGLRHLAFEVNSVEMVKLELEKKGIGCENIRIDPHTNRKFAFFQDPDGLPIEIYEIDS
jgi:glyoxylase I family protein